MTAQAKKSTLSPMLTQYLEYKEEYPEALLLFQVGDFYELFFEDAVTVSKALNLTLTSRDKNQAEPIPMCGVPIAVVDGYLDRLVDLGHSVAVVSQCSTPVPGKMVERKLERMITPAVRVMGGAESDPSKGNFLAAICYREDGDGAMLYTQIESGRIYAIDALTPDELIRELIRVAPAEIVLPKEIDQKTIDKRLGWVRSIEQSLPHAKLRMRLFAESLQKKKLPGYSALSSSGKKAAQLLIRYIDETTVDSSMSMKEILLKKESESLVLDATTRRNLELVTSLKDNTTEGTLFGYLRKTVTAGGTRLLRNWILSPLINKDSIVARQAAVGSLLYSTVTTQTLKKSLATIPDLNRLAARIELGVVSPRELAALRDALMSFPAIKKELRSTIKRRDSFRIKDLDESLVFPESLLELLQSSLTENPPIVTAHGDFIRPDYDEELARLIHIRTHGKKWLTELEARERESTGIPTLKVKFNNVLGYFIEVTAKYKESAPDYYIRRQSMANAERFSTPELKAREQEILTAKSKQFERERELYDELKKSISTFTDEIRDLNDVVSEIDVLASFAEVASKAGWIAPNIVEVDTLEVEQGRHPILSDMLGRSFIANDISFCSDTRQTLLLTGPNMGGKSTYLRQTALIVLLAQIGAYVPAEAATIGIVDRIFARLGASDDQTEGESTFMVEMKEASLILSQATKRSLVLIDEIGRGTATADGLALAQAILEKITRDIGCRCLFATHFHQLTELEDTYPMLTNICVGSLERDGAVHFTHQICDGPANRSYGIEVAKMAELPPMVISRAEGLLARESLKAPAETGDQLSFQYSAPRIIYKEPDDYEKLSQLRDSLQSVSIDETTPLEALSILSKIKSSLT